MVSVIHSVEEVARRLRRDRSSIWHLLAHELDERVGVGRKKAIDESGKGRLVALADMMAKKADVRWLVTAEMIQQKFTPKVSVRTLGGGFHERGVWWHKSRTGNKIVGAATKREREREREREAEREIYTYIYMLSLHSGPRRRGSTCQH